MQRLGGGKVAHRLRLGGLISTRRQDAKGVVRVHKRGVGARTRLWEHSPASALTPYISQASEPSTTYTATEDTVKGFRLRLGWGGVGGGGSEAQTN